MAAGLEGLRIFRLAETLADATWEEVITWKPFARDTLGRELIRAADSIGANIAEGHGRFHYRDQINSDYYGRGSLKETRFWLRRDVARKIIPAETFQRLVAMVDELEPQLNEFIKSWTARAATSAQRGRRATGVGKH